MHHFQSTDPWNAAQKDCTPFHLYYLNKEYLHTLILNPWHCIRSDRKTHPWCGCSSSMTAYWPPCCFTLGQIWGGSKFSLGSSCMAGRKRFWMALWNVIYDIPLLLVVTVMSSMLSFWQLGHGVTGQRKLHLIPENHTTPRLLHPFLSPTAAEAAVAPFFLQYKNSLDRRLGSRSGAERVGVRGGLAFTQTEQRKHLTEQPLFTPLSVKDYFFS